MKAETLLLSVFVSLLMVIGIISSNKQLETLHAPSSPDFLNDPSAYTHSTYTAYNANENIRVVNIDQSEKTEQ